MIAKQSKTQAQKNVSEKCVFETKKRMRQGQKKMRFSKCVFKAQKRVFESCKFKKKKSIQNSFES